eukprot:TRINITY_DN18793_c0_g1_i1.p1 TRINITY_DN18793_c0_g1~~TRINITY_DN18793_c0_g1_i1.p1  ORF type:complete len:167 (+),score=31.07 TRINITY_DN18793_c0_g1_i1:51-503(+)
MMKKVAMLLAVLTASGASEIPSGRYCGDLSLMFSSEHIELFINEENETFDFGAKGLMTIPWCPGNAYTKEVNEKTGDINGRPDVNKLTKCLEHELRHIGGVKDGKVPISVTWKKETDTIDMAITGVPVLGELSISLSRDCKKHLADHDEL